MYIFILIRLSSIIYERIDLVCDILLVPCGVCEWKVYKV